MPVNLNALIRYKTIDKCLTNPNASNTIDHLMEKCSIAIKECSGTESGVSERTIRNDIRILRSDILDFNAPIIVEDGRYKYSIPNYTIFGRPVEELELLKEIQQVFTDEFHNIDK